LLIGLLIGSHFLCPSGEEAAMAVGGTVPVIKEVVYQSKGPAALGTSSLANGRNTSGYGCSLSDVLWLHIPSCGISLSMVIIGCT
jgi:hypothetical protein